MSVSWPAAEEVTDTGHQSAAAMSERRLMVGATTNAGEALREWIGGFAVAVVVPAVGRGLVGSGERLMRERAGLKVSS
jgi:hypothetical protein